MKGTLEGKLALVTGAGSGIGRATALALADKGARLVVCDRDPARVDGIATALGARCALAKTVDVSKKDEMRTLADQVHERLGALDVLVNNAGVGHSGGMLDSTIEDWEWVVSVNLWGVIHGCHFFVPKMVERGAGGHVANVASGFGLFASPGVSPYCTTKFAVVGLTESLRAELEPHGIGVSAICPGLIATDIVKSGRFADEKMRDGVVEAFRRRGRKPEQVAQAIVRAIRADVAVVPVGIEAWGAWLGKRMSPSLMGFIAKRVERAAKKSVL